MTLRIGVEFRIGPARQRAAQRLPRRLDARLAVDDEWPPPSTTSVSQNSVRRSWPFQPFHTPGPTARMSPTVSASSIFRRSRVCTIAGNVSAVLRVEQIAALRHDRHHQMLLDQPGHALGVGGRQPEPRTSLRATSAPASE